MISKNVVAVSNGSEKKGIDEFVDFCRGTTKKMINFLLPKKQQQTPIANVSASIVAARTESPLDFPLRFEEETASSCSSPAWCRSSTTTSCSSSRASNCSSSGRSSPSCDSDAASTSSDESRHSLCSLSNSSASIASFESSPTFRTRRSAVLPCERDLLRWEGEADSDCESDSECSVPCARRLAVSPRLEDRLRWAEEGFEDVDSKASHGQQLAEQRGADLATEGERDMDSWEEEAIDSDSDVELSHPRRLAVQPRRIEVRESERMLEELEQEFLEIAEPVHPRRMAVQRRRCDRSDSE